MQHMSNQPAGLLRLICALITEGWSTWSCRSWTCCSYNVNTVNIWDMVMRIIFFFFYKAWTLSYRIWSQAWMGNRMKSIKTCFQTSCIAFILWIYKIFGTNWWVCHMAPYKWILMRGSAVLTTLSFSCFLCTNPLVKLLTIWASVLLSSSEVLHFQLISWCRAAGQVPDEQKLICTLNFYYWELCFTEYWAGWLLKAVCTEELPCSSLTLKSTEQGLCHCSCW